MSRQDDTEFELTEQHLKLVRHFNFEWQHCETGAPAVNPKRPFGNSDVPPDIADLLGWPWPDENELSADVYDREALAMHEKCMAVYMETMTALAIVAQHAGGAVMVGRYTNRARLYHRPEWKRDGEASS